MTSVTPDAPASGRARGGVPSLWTKFAFGVGAVASGIKSGGFDYFFLLFYSQVIGLQPWLVGLALTIALIFDAVSDPIVGYWSDNFHSRWGRRHPFMYASAIPLGLSYFLIWNPPIGWSDMAVFWYVLGLAVSIRTFITFFETPNLALAPDLTQDYDQRSSLLSYRYFFGWWGGNTMTVMMFFAVFPAFVTAELADGRFNRDAYAFYGIVASVLIFGAIMLSALGTHSRIPYLASPPPKRTMTLGRIFRELFETLSERSFVSLFAAMLFGAIATGLAGALTFYFLAYFWEFDTLQTGAVTLSTFLSAIIGFLLAPVVTRRMGKKRGAIVVGLIAFIGAPLPIFLRLLDLMPENGTPALFWIVFVTSTVDVGLIICFQILAASMMADLVEQSEVKTGRRSEGTFFAAMTFIRKVVQGIGIALATVILTLAQFPQGTAPGEVPADAIWWLGALYAPTILGIWMLMMLCVSTYKIDRAQHEENLRRLAGGSPPL